MVGFLLIPISQFPYTATNPLFSSVVNFTLAVGIGSPTDLTATHPAQPVKLTFKSVALPTSGGYHLYYKPSSASDYSGCPATASEEAAGKRCITINPTDRTPGITLDAEIADKLLGQAYDFRVRAFSDTMTANESPLPCASCEVQNFSVTGESATPIAVKPEPKGGTFYEKSYITEVVSPLHATSTESSFSDVDSSHWALPFITNLQNRRVITGYPDGTMRPDGLFNRAEAAKIALLVFAGEPLSSVEKSFPDVSQKAWFTSYIIEAKKVGIINGYGDGFYRPEKPASRAEALKIAMNATGFKSVAAHSSFSDVPDYAWFAPYVTWAEQQGIIEGYLVGDTRVFRPNTPITRAEMFKLLSILLDIKEKGYSPYAFTPKKQEPASKQATTAQVNLSNSVKNKKQNSVVKTKNSAVTSKSEVVGEKTISTEVLTQDTQLHSVDSKEGSSEATVNIPSRSLLQRFWDSAVKLFTFWK